jgi:hypothetical protein
MKLKDGSITITTKRAAIKNLDRIILSDVSLFVSRGQKNLTINAQNCELEPKKKKAQLSGNILIVSPDFSAKTRMVSIDWLKGTISGNSRIDGQKDNMKFTADGFSVKKNGKIELKHARIVKA